MGCSKYVKANYYSNNTILRPNAACNLITPQLQNIKHDITVCVVDNYYYEIGCMYLLTYGIIKNLFSSLIFTYLQNNEHKFFVSNKLLMLAKDACSKL